MDWDKTASVDTGGLKIPADGWRRPGRIGGHGADAREPVRGRWDATRREPGAGRNGSAGYRSPVEYP